MFSGIDLETGLRLGLAGAGSGGGGGLSGNGILVHRPEPASRFRTTLAPLRFRAGQERVLCRPSPFAYPRIGNRNFDRPGLGFRICKF